jgi:hypothetical protein
MTMVPPMQREEVTQRPLRVLTAWLSEQEAILALLGRQPMSQEELEEVSRKIAACKAVLAARPVFSPTNSVIDMDDPVLQAVKERPDIRAAFAGLNWCPAMVDLRGVLAFQKVISVEGLEARLASAHLGKEQLFELCLPPEQPLSPSAIVGEMGGRAFTVSSLNPNLRIVGSQVGVVEMNPGSDLPSVQVQALMFLISTGTSYLQVVHYKGRYFIRDGYHRAVGLLREGINMVPCILIDAQNFHEQVVLSRPQEFLPYELLFGDRPPRLTDFWDDDVADAVQRPATRKVIRVRGDEFDVLR